MPRPAAIIRRFRASLCILPALWMLSATPPAAEPLRILTLDEPPLGYYREDGAFIGISVDAVNALKDRVGARTIIQVMPWKRAYHTALTKPNILIFTMARTAEREDLFHWILPVNQNVFAFYARRGNSLSFKSLEDMRASGATIGVLAGGVREKLLRKRGFGDDAIRPLHSNYPNVRKLFLGRLDLVFFSPVGLARICAREGLDFSELAPAFQFRPPNGIAYVALSKQGTDPALLTALLDAAAAMREDGTMARIASDWIDRIETDYRLSPHYDEKQKVINLWEASNDPLPLIDW